MQDIYIYKTQNKPNIPDIKFGKKETPFIPPEKPKTEYSECSDLRKERIKIIDSFERSVRNYEEAMSKSSR